MVGSIVVEFLTDRPFARRSVDGSGNRNVAGIVRSLSGRFHGSRAGAEPNAPLPIGLSDLAGIGDETIGRLAGLARDGVITPATAARLAMRHADESGGRCPRRVQEGSNVVRWEPTPAGDARGRFAIRLRGKTAWILFSPTAGVDLLAELCLRERIQVCLLMSFDAGGEIIVRLLNSADWRRRLVGIGADANRCDGSQVLLLGGLPLREPDRSRALAGIERAIRRSENTKLISSSLGKRVDAEMAAPIPDPARELLTMIELAFPGLIDGPAPGGGPA